MVAVTHLVTVMMVLGTAKLYLLMHFITISCRNAV